MSCNLPHLPHAAYMYKVATYLNLYHVILIKKRYKSLHSLCLPWGRISWFSFTTEISEGDRGAVKSGRKSCWRYCAAPLRRDDHRVKPVQHKTALVNIACSDGVDEISW